MFVFVVVLIGLPVLGIRTFAATQILFQQDHGRTLNPRSPARRHRR